MNRLLKTIPIILVILSLFPACAQAPQKSRDEAEFLIYSLLVNVGCEESTKQTHLPTFIINETYNDNSFGDEEILSRVPSISQQTLDDYQIISQETQSLDPALIKNKGTCKFIRSDEQDEYTKKYINLPVFISFSRIGFNKGFDQAIVYRVYDCGGECARNDLYVMVREGKVWTLKTIMEGWRS